MSIKRVARFLSVPLAIASLLTVSTDGHAQQRLRERIRPAFPQLSIPERQSAGQAAIDRLGAKLPDVASWYGKSSDQLRRQILSDRGVRVDNKGRMFVVEQMEAPLQATTSAAQQGVMQGQILALDQTFLLHSRPNAKLTLYIDFNGATLTGTAWNSNGNTLTAKPFDIDGAPATFSNTELERIQYIWQRVAEDYAPFDIDVTTEQPAPDRLIRTDANDQVFGTTALVTDNTGIYSCSCGGVAYVGVFNDTSSYYKPALVFFNMLGSGSEKPVAEAISHEVGHNIGLSHDGASGTNATNYYQGQGSDAVTGWAPIMGVGYYKSLVQFSRGEYANANNLEDDFAVAQSYGLALRQDDVGNTTVAATPIPGATGGTLDGVIERAGDIDVYSVSVGAGAFTASVVPASRSANADLVLSLRDSAGAVLATSDPQNALNGALSYQITTAGTYYISVTGTGQGDPATTGYSSYGSVGNYRVSTSFTASDDIAPTAVLTASTTTGIAPVAVTLDASQSNDSDGTVKFYYWDFGDGTSDTTGSLQSVTKTYAAAGTYSARLTVVDDKGLSASATQPITVGSAIPVNTVSIGSLNLNLVAGRKRTAKAVATVVVVNQLGQAMANATVSVTWSGITRSSATLQTTGTGAATFGTGLTKARGCFILTVTSLSLPGYAVDKAALPSKQICR